MKFFGGSNMTAIEALDRELIRLNSQMNSYSFTGPTNPDDPIVKAYMALIETRQKIHESLVKLATESK